MSGALAAATASPTQAGPSGVTIFPDYVSGIMSSFTVTSDAATVSPPSASYVWTRVNGDVLTVDNPGARTTSFSATPTIGEPLNATYRCTTAEGSATVTVYLERT